MNHTYFFFCNQKKKTSLLIFGLKKDVFVHNFIDGKDILYLFFWLFCKPKRILKIVKLFDWTCDIILTSLNSTKINADKSFFFVGTIASVRSSYVSWSKRFDCSVALENSLKLFFFFFLDFNDRNFSLKFFENEKKNISSREWLFSTYAFLKYIQIRTTTMIIFLLFCLTQVKYGPQYSNC